MQVSNEEVAGFYDTFTSHQRKIGISERQRIIYTNLKKIGLCKDSNVLEVGCGIGTVSKLIIKNTPLGKFVGCDISSKSIEMAKRFNPQKNVEFICTDMSDFTHDIKFDFIVFPDVLEHIPVNKHKNLFEKIAKVSSPDAKILINIPEPNSLNWYRENKPELLQIIDQSLSVQDLLNNLYPLDFKVESVRPYSIHTNINNYLSIVFVKNSKIKEIYSKNKLTNFIFNIKTRLNAM